MGIGAELRIAQPPEWPDYFFAIETAHGHVRYTCMVSLAGKSFIFYSFGDKPYGR
jgi:hypothetical protein